MLTSAALDGRFDLVLMDIQMPEVDGLEATRLIRQHEEHTNPPLRTPILALTAHASQCHRDQCLEAGMDGMITKPVDRETLLGCVAEVLGRLAPA